jgi:hypothetical protein
MPNPQHLHLIRKNKYVGSMWGKKKARQLINSYLTYPLVTLLGFKPKTSTAVM